MPNNRYILLKSYPIPHQGFHKIKGPKDTASLIGNDPCLEDLGAQVSKNTICFKIKM